MKKQNRNKNRETRQRLPDRLERGKGVLLERSDRLLGSEEVMSGFTTVSCVPLVALKVSASGQKQ